MDVAGTGTARAGKVVDVLTATLAVGGVTVAGSVEVTVGAAGRAALPNTSGPGRGSVS